MPPIDDLPPVSPASSSCECTSGNCSYSGCTGGCCCGHCASAAGAKPLDPEVTMHMIEPHEEDDTSETVDATAFPNACAPLAALWEYTSVDGVTNPGFNTEASFRICRASKFAAGMCVRVASGNCELELKINRIDEASDGTGTVYFVLSDNPVNLDIAVGKQILGPLKVWQVPCFTSQAALCGTTVSKKEDGTIGVFEDVGDECNIAQKCLGEWNPQDPNGGDPNDNPALGYVFMQAGKPVVLTKDDLHKVSDVIQNWVGTLVGYGTGGVPVVLTGPDQSALMYWDKSAGRWQSLARPTAGTGLYRLELDSGSGNMTPKWTPVPTSGEVYYNRELWYNSDSVNYGPAIANGLNEIDLTNLSVYGDPPGPDIDLSGFTNPKATVLVRLKEAPGFNPQLTIQSTHQTIPGAPGPEAHVYLWGNVPVISNKIQFAMNGWDSTCRLKFQLWSIYST